MKITIVGSGYVGLSLAVGLANKGNEIVCVDQDEEKVEKVNNGEPYISEPSLDNLLNEGLEKELIKATTNLGEAVEGSNLVFMTVGTPQAENGSIDLSNVEQAVKDIGKALRESEGYCVVVVKSTVVPGTTKETVIPILEKESGKEVGEEFGVCVNPEFLREGNAISDFLNPDRIVIGEYDEQSGDLLSELYADFDAPALEMDLKTAEMVKYASNSFLATKISFINEIGNICKRLGIDVYEIAEAMGLDERISPRFLRAGPGYGGSCFPKDVRALISKAESEGYSPGLLKAGVSINESQPLKMLELLKRHIEGIEDKTIGVLGLSFKPDTDDIRGAPALKIVENLLEEGATVKAYDPEAMDKFEERFPTVNYCDEAEEVLESDATLIVTDWERFKDLDYSGKTIIDGRGIEKAREAEIYEGICW